MATVRTVKIAIPGQQAHEITIEHGTEKLRPASEATSSQRDVTVRFENVDGPESQLRQQAADREVSRQAVTEIHTDQFTVDPATGVTIGNVTIRPTTISGWEAKFTRGGVDPVEVLVGGERQTGSAALLAVYEALMAQKKVKK